MNVADDLYADEFRVSSSSIAPFAPPPAKQQKVDPASAQPAAPAPVRTDLYPYTDPACCVSLNVRPTATEAFVRALFGAAEVSFVSFVTDQVTGSSLGRCFVCFGRPEEAEIAKREPAIAAVSKRDFEELMDRLNLRRSKRRSSRSKSREKRRSRSKSREKRRSRSREKHKSRSREKKRERESGSGRDRDRDRERARDKGEKRRK
jgi:RNA recognition motif-containing protein